MKAQTNYITEMDWSELLLLTFVWIDDAHQKVAKDYEHPTRKHTPKKVAMFSDSEVITLTLFGEMVFEGDESKTLHFIRQYHQDMFPNLLTDGRFNRRKRRLTDLMESMRCHMRDKWQEEHAPEEEIDADLRLVDSLPVPMCTYKRGSRCQSVPIDDRDAYFGVCASKGQKIFGLKCHAIVTLEQMIDTWCVTPASFDDRKPLPALLEGYQQLCVIGDKGYISQDLEQHLFDEGEHILLSFKRKGQKQQWQPDIQKIMGRLRHRVETSFSVLATSFSFQRVGSRSMSGVIARLTAKILAHTLSFFLADYHALQLSN